MQAIQTSAHTADQQQQINKGARVTAMHGAQILCYLPLLLLWLAPLEAAGSGSGVVRLSS